MADGHGVAGGDASGWAVVATGTHTVCGRLAMYRVQYFIAKCANRGIVFATTTLGFATYRQGRHPYAIQMATPITVDVDPKVDHTLTFASEFAHSST